MPSASISATSPASPSCSRTRPTRAADPDDPGVVGTAPVLEILETMVRRYDDGTPRTKHVTTNLVIDADDDGTSATARSYYTVLQQLDDFPLQPIIAGRYHDRFEVLDGDVAPHRARDLLRSRRRPVSAISRPTRSRDLRRRRPARPARHLPTTRSTQRVRHGALCGRRRLRSTRPRPTTTSRSSS